MHFIFDIIFFLNQLCMLYDITTLTYTSYIRTYTILYIGNSNKDA